MLDYAGAFAGFRADSGSLCLCRVLPAGLMVGKGGAAAGCGKDHD
jgi:hypothetical protein